MSLHDNREGLVDEGHSVTLCRFRSAVMLRAGGLPLRSRSMQRKANDQSPCFPCLPRGPKKLGGSKTACVSPFFSLVRFPWVGVPAPPRACHSHSLTSSRECARGRRCSPSSRRDRPSSSPRRRRCGTPPGRRRRLDAIRDPTVRSPYRGRREGRYAPSARGDPARR